MQPVAIGKGKIRGDISDQQRGRAAAHRIDVQAVTLRSASIVHRAATGSDCDRVKQESGRAVGSRKGLTRFAVVVGVIIQAVRLVRLAGSDQLCDVVNSGRRGIGAQTCERHLVRHGVRHGQRGETSRRHGPGDARAVRSLRGEIIRRAGQQAGHVGREISRRRTERDTVRPVMPALVPPLLVP